MADPLNPKAALKVYIKYLIGALTKNKPVVQPALGKTDQALGTLNQALTLDWDNPWELDDAQKARTLLRAVYWTLIGLQRLPKANQPPSWATQVQPVVDKLLRAIVATFPYDPTVVTASVSNLPKQISLFERLAVYGTQEAFLRAIQTQNPPSQLTGQGLHALFETLSHKIASGQTPTPEEQAAWQENKAAFEARMLGLEKQLIHAAEHPAEAPQWRAEYQAIKEIEERLG
jgi:hypothetical protein